MSSDTKIHEPGTSWCLGYSRTRSRDMHNNAAQHLNFFRYKTCKTLQHNNGEVFGSDNYLWSWGSDTARKMRRVSFPSNAQLKVGLGCDSGFGRNTRTVSCENHCNTRQLKVEMIKGKQNWGPSRASMINMQGTQPKLLKSWEKTDDTWFCQGNLWSQVPLPG